MSGGTISFMAKGLGSTMLVIANLFSPEVAYLCNGKMLGWQNDVLVKCCGGPML